MSAFSGLTGPSGLAGFSDVDACNAGEYVAYLDACAAGAGAGKMESYRSQGIAAGSKVLDLGCGTGDDVRTLSDIVGPAGHVAGLDSSHVLIDEAVRRGVPENAEFTAASAYALPFSDGVFDAIRAERVLQHLERPEECAREAYRVLKSRGSLFVLDQDWETIAVAGGDREITRRVVRAFVDGLAHGWAGRSHAGLLKSAGFADVAVSAGVNMLPLAAAYAFVLQPAVTAAKRQGVVSEEEADQWLVSLLEANRRGDFFYSVCVFATLARK